MRRGAYVAMLLVAAALVGCKGEQNSARAAESGDELEQELSQDEQDLIARRDALLSARESIRERRETLSEKRAAIASQGGDTTEVDNELSTLRDHDSMLNDTVSTLEEIADKQRALIGAADKPGANVAAREAALAAREKALASREERLAGRERVLADREDELATKWKDTCAAGGPTIIQTVDAKGSSYGKRDVESLLKRTAREMSQKGILISDLPANAKGLRAEAESRMKKADYGGARFAADQLYQIVRATKVNKGFVSNKWARLDRVMKGKRLSEDQESLLSSAAANIADGKFSSANQKLNRLFASVN